MMPFVRRHSMCQLLIAILMCMPLAGQTQLNNEGLLQQEISSSSNMTNKSSQAGNNETTSSTKGWYFLSKEEEKKLDIATMTVATTGALFNFLVIIAMVIDPLKVLHKGPWVTILNLAIADLISCISCFCIWGRQYLGHENVLELYYAIWIFLWGFGVSASFLWLTFLTVQIFIITKYPLRSRYCFNTLRIILAGIAVWLFAFVLGLSQITYLHFPEKVSLKLWIARIGVLQIALVVQVILNIRVTIEIIKSGRSVGNAQNAKHKNIAKTVIILTLILFLTAFPYFLLIQIEYLSRLRYFGQSETAKTLSYLSYYYAPIAVLNFMANPILYSLRLPDYRQTLFAFVCKSRLNHGSPKRSMQTMSSKLTAFSMRSQRTSETSPEKCKSYSMDIDQSM